MFTPAAVTTPRTVTLGVTVSDGAASTTGSVDVVVTPARGSGGVASDSSGQGNTGAQRECPDVDDADSGGALWLNGTTQDVRVGDSASLSIAGLGSRR